MVRRDLYRTRFLSSEVAAERRRCAKIVKSWYELGHFQVDLEENAWPDAEKLAAAILGDCSPF